MEKLLNNNIINDKLRVHYTIEYYVIYSFSVNVHGTFLVTSYNVTLLSRVRNVRPDRQVCRSSSYIIIVACQLNTVQRRLKKCDQELSLLIMIYNKSINLSYIAILIE